MRRGSGQRSAVRGQRPEVRAVRGQASGIRGQPEKAGRPVAAGRGLAKWNYVELCGITWNGVCGKKTEIGKAEKRKADEERRGN